jgi:hypothetical protein
MPSSGSIVVSAGRTPLPTAKLAILDTSVYIPTLITCNREDFTEIGKHVTFKVIFW